jgi:hypothetical protein
MLMRMGDACFLFKFFYPCPMVIHPFRQCYFPVLCICLCCHCFFYCRLSYVAIVSFIAACPTASASTAVVRGAIEVLVCACPYSRLLNRLLVCACACFTSCKSLFVAMSFLTLLTSDLMLLTPDCRACIAFSMSFVSTIALQL